MPKSAFSDSNIRTHFDKEMHTIADYVLNKKIISIEAYKIARHNLMNSMDCAILWFTLDEMIVEYPLGHPRRRKEGLPLLERKFRDNLLTHFPTR